MKTLQAAGWPAVARYKTGMSSPFAATVTDLVPVMDQGVLGAAAGTAAEDAVAKMEWLLDVCVGSCSLQESTVDAAAQSGGLEHCVRWAAGYATAATRWARHARVRMHCQTPVAQWRVDVGGCELSMVGSDDIGWRGLLVKFPASLTQWPSGSGCRGEGRRRPTARAVPLS